MGIEFHRLLDEKANPEYWINLLTLDDFFSSSLGGEEKAIALAKALVEIWRTKLRNDFPDQELTVECLYDNETGDCGLTFYQVRKDHIQTQAESKRAMPTPNIKENKVNYSPNGLRPGMPEIRKPDPDEVPK